LISGVFALVVFKPLSPVLTGQLPLKNGSQPNLYKFLFWMTLLIGTIFSIFTPMLQYFRFLYLIPIMALIINKNRLIAAGFFIFSMVYVLNPGFYREDWKSATQTLTDKVYMISSFGDPVKYYKNVKVIDIREKITDKTITVIPYGEAIHGVDHNKILDKEGYKKVSEKSYRDVVVEGWAKDEIH
jgi:hypothetical protein